MAIVGGAVGKAQDIRQRRAFRPEMGTLGVIRAERDGCAVTFPAATAEVPDRS
ncbi:hypothetical protein KEM60_02430 [Austwickia sp. TVS 96-490-7B]|nr:hypothetical protein [Austwickia sp. TVS 96-490-7B]